MYQILKAKIEAILHLNRLCEFRNQPEVHPSQHDWLDIEIAELERDIVRRNCQ
ncbi:hypothetical protein PALU110988_18740 [Paenibacillus lupini]|nr:hypothetical protein [Paenibacillus lupini]